MRIVSHKPLDAVCEINMRLYSADRKFQCIIEPPSYPMASADGKVTIDRDASVCFEFMDTYEIDQLINILQRFKKDNCRQFGAWV